MKLSKVVRANYKWWPTSILHWPNKSRPMENQHCPASACLIDANRCPLRYETDRKSCSKNIGPLKLTRTWVRLRKRPRWSTGGRKAGISSSKLDNSIDNRLLPLNPFYVSEVSHLNQRILRIWPKNMQVLCATVPMISLNSPTKQMCRCLYFRLVRDLLSN